MRQFFKGGGRKYDFKNVAKLTLCTIGMCLIGSAIAETSPYCKVGASSKYKEFAEIWSVSMGGKVTRPETIKSSRTKASIIANQGKDYRTIDTYMNYAKSQTKVDFQWNQSLKAYLGYEILNGDGKGIYGLNAVVVHPRPDGKSLDLCWYYNIVWFYSPEP